MKRATNPNITFYRLNSLYSPQSEESVRLNSTFDQRLRSLELRHAEADTLLHVHASLLYELQTQLRNLSATAQRLSRGAGCTINVIKTTPLLGMRDTLPPGTRCWAARWGRFTHPLLRQFTTSALLPAGNRTPFFFSRHNFAMCFRFLTSDPLKKKRPVSNISLLPVFGK